MPFNWLQPAARVHAVGAPASCTLLGRQGSPQEARQLRCQLLTHTSPPQLRILGRRAISALRASGARQSAVPAPAPASSDAQPVLQWLPCFVFCCMSSLLAEATLLP